MSHFYIEKASLVVELSTGYWTQRTNSGSIGPKCRRIEPSTVKYTLTNNIENDQEKNMLKDYILKYYTW